MVGGSNLPEGSSLPGSDELNHLVGPISKFENPHSCFRVMYVTFLGKYLLTSLDDPFVLREPLFAETL
jgi:hypothetical protein